MVSKNVKKNIYFFLFFLIGKIRHGIGEKRWLFSIGNGAEIRPLEMCRESPERGTLAKNTDPDENLIYVVFHQGLHCLLRQNPFSEEKIKF